MDEILAEMRRIANRLRRAARPLLAGPERGVLDRLAQAAEDVGKAWSGGYLGYHSRVYKSDLQPCAAGDHFDVEWGTGGTFSNRTRGDWAEFTQEGTSAEIYARAGVSEAAAQEAARPARVAQETFESAKKDLLPLVDALLAHEADDTLRDIREKMGKLRPGFSMEELADRRLPKQARSRDTRAAFAGVQVPPHIQKELWVLHALSRADQCAALADVAEHARRYLLTRASLKGSQAPGVRPKVFIGHGRSPVWKDLKDFVIERLLLEYDEFDRESAAGKSTKERLEEMLEGADFAFLVFTGEDELADGSKAARPNVIHEAGLFQSKLGFEKAIALVEEGCDVPSNLTGVTQIRFPSGNVLARTEDIRMALEKAGLV